MRAVVQRVSYARVRVGDELVGVVVVELFDAELPPLHAASRHASASKAPAR